MSEMTDHLADALVYSAAMRALAESMKSSIDDFIVASLLADQQFTDLANGDPTAVANRWANRQTIENAAEIIWHTQGGQLSNGSNDVCSRFGYMCDLV